VLLNTLAPSAVASVSDTTSLTGAFGNYLITFQNVLPTTTAALVIRVATAGTSFQTTGYNATNNIDSSTSTSFIPVTGVLSTTGVATTAGYGVSGDVMLYGPSSSNNFKFFFPKTIYTQPGTTLLFNTGGGGAWVGTTTAITGLNFAFSTGNIATGIIKIYGLA
jgi:hypothetical protein